MIVKVSDYIAEFLVQSGINDVFMVTGGGAMHLDDSLGHNKGLTCVFNHHEQACAIAAEAYCRLTNKLPAVCVTSGPGGTNALTGVLGAWLDSVPMFVLSGQVKCETTITSCPDVNLRQLGDQEFNITDCVDTMTKYSKFVDNAEDVSYHLEKALFLCKEGRGGPVWLDIPLDIQAAKVETDNMKHFDCGELTPSYPVYDSSNTEVIIDKIKNSKRPVILAGTGIRLGDAHFEFIKLIEALNIPVVTAWNAHDVIWNEHPLYCGRPGTLGDRGGNFVVQNCDLLISLGCRLNIRQISYSYKDFAKDAYKIIVDIDEAELHKPTISPDLPIHADVKDVIRGVLASKFINVNNTHAEWLSWCKNVENKYPVTLSSYYEMEKPLNPYVFIDELCQKLPEESKVVTGNGSACVITFQAAFIKKGQRYFTNSGCAAMGYGFPAALGCCVAEKGKQIICIDGDGSFQMNIQELQTVVYNKMNMKIFYLNNNGYHSIRQTQTNLFHPPFVGVCDGNGLSFPNMEKIAYAYGLRYVCIDSLERIQEKLEEVLNGDDCVVCEVVVDPNQNFEPKLSSKVMPDGKIISPSIDDMYPFLEREEYENNKKSG